jgi:D-glycero-D-manno-heptose 1,7-bisphosphate phosphatase
MNKAVFFDRDGVINNTENHYYVYNADDFEINNGIIDGMKILQDAGFKLLVISNQGGISKGVFTKRDTDNVHRFMLDYFRKHAISIDEIYYCPHHSDVENCLCRKPDSLMIEKALARFDIDPNKSFMIGDSIRDIEAGEKAGIKSCKIDKNENIFNLCKKLSTL